MALQQQTRTRQSISQSQSLAVVQTLLRAGLGCITFLRNLLPDDNFSESHFTTSEDIAHSSSQTSGSSSIEGIKQKNGGLKVMTMARGYSEEADRILDYLEHGIFDALEKQYLRSFIFAIYLDSKDPNNIVEAYTFNFRYFRLPGSDAIVPIMSLGEDLRKLRTGSKDDPVTEAAKNGQVPTLRDVRRSVKTLLKTLINAMSQMDVLPKRRYATFKVFYTDSTPTDYEPPYFQAGDSDKDRWYMMTHNMDEVPDKWSIGKISTGHHSVNLNIASIATYLPSTEGQEAAFTGATEFQWANQNLTPLQEAILRAEQNEQQEGDAEMRNIVWHVEPEAVDLDMDAEGEDDPDYARQEDGSFSRISDSHILVPLGIRNRAGVIEPIPMTRLGEEAVYNGKLESVPMHLNDLNDQTPQVATECDETQTFAFDDQNSALPPSDFPETSPLSARSNVSHPYLVSQEFDDETSLLARMSLNDATGKGENSTTDLSVIGEGQGSQPTIRRSTRHRNISQEMGMGRHALGSRSVKADDKGLACECGVSIEDECCFCEGGCARWLHIWCIGYHSINDKRIPAKFICLDCRLRADISWELIKSDLYPRLIMKYRDLALYRRAIKISEEMNVLTPLNFAKRLGTDFTQSRHLLKRLENEGFVQEHVQETDELGLIKSRPKKKSLKKQRRNNIQKKQYRFQKATVDTSVYLTYFDPSIQVENGLLGIGHMVAKYQTRPATLAKITAVCAKSAQARSETPAGTKTQGGEAPMAVTPEGQVTPTRTNKRTATNDNADCPLKKKKKISVTKGVDLAE